MPAKFPAITASLALSALVALPSFAQESDAGGKFELSATINSKAQLSRGEVDKSSLGMGSLANPRPVQRGEALIANAPPRMIPQQPQQNDDTPGSFMQEYNVDWSHWVSTQADRWFYILRSAETQLGVRFDTPRPALIQFTCYADGSIGNLVLKQSSGVPAYDRLQVEALLATMPTMPFPKGTVRKSITLCQGWESHRKRPGETDFQPGSFGRDFPLERVRQWLQGR